MKKIAVTAVLLLCLFVGCLKPKNTEERHQILTICNRSDRDIYCKSGDLWGNLVNYNPVKQENVYLIRANDCKNEYADAFEEYIERSDSNRLTYYFFDSEILHTVPWDTVYHRRMFSVRHYTKPMLDSLNWRVEFP